MKKRNCKKRQITEAYRMVAIEVEVLRRDIHAYSVRKIKSVQGVSESLIDINPIKVVSTFEKLPGATNAESEEFKNNISSIIDTPGGHKVLV